MTAPQRAALSGAFSFCLLLTINCVVMKLVGKGFAATWSWWSVTAPLWIPALAIVSLSLLAIGLVRVLKRVG